MDGVSDHHMYCAEGFDPDDIVISGMAGRFPECSNVGELEDGLYQKKNLMVYRDDRYEKGCSNMPYCSVGILKELDKLDIDYFCITPSNANSMDPATRIHMEITYEAVADAGYDPAALKKANIGVYNATTCDDAMRIRINSDKGLNLNLIRAMNPNRTTFAFDWIGPSYAIDAACSSSAIAVWTACNDIREGRVDAAVVTGTQLNLAPDLYFAYFTSGICSKGGSSIPFDANTDGMLRTEACTALFLQKAKNARRAYATVASSKHMSSGFIPEGITVPSTHYQARIMRESLSHLNLDIDDIEFVEAHGTGTLVGDPIELNALAEVYCQNRNRPLLVGAIKSNIGHTEASSGICGIMKSILAFENESIPPNMNYTTPNPNCAPLVEGKIEIVTEPTPFSCNYIPVNSLGFGGTLVQTILKKNARNYGEKKEAQVLPRLVMHPATTEDAIMYIFEYIQNHPDLRDEFFALLHKLSFTNPFFKPFRGFAIFQEGKILNTQFKKVSTDKRQVWFVMTGMGCQWPGMGLQLMGIDVFAESMKKSAAVLKPYGIDLFEILRADKNSLQIDRNITPAFVAISAIQIAMVDLLTHLDIQPDGIVGHSTGELLCAYADGCCTAEQTILSALWRGKSVEAANLPSGSMAAVGLSWKDAQRLCPKGVHPACDNADDSVTISGLKEPLEQFVQKLQSENIFARVVNAYGYGFHSEYVHGAAPALREALKKIIPNPKPRTQRWVSSSYPESEWDAPNCKIATPEYFVHNLMSCVRFTDAIKKIPSDAVVIEIGPHFLLQSILKRAVGSGASFFGLMKRNEPDNVAFFLESIGKLYNEGLNPKIERLYPAVEFPVPRATPRISDIIKWKHDQSFFVPKYAPLSGEYFYEARTEKKDAYLLDHQIDGRSLFPATGFVYIAWEALAVKLQKPLREMPVMVQNLKIHRATILSPQAPTVFRVNVMESTGHFEITEGKSLVASGDVFHVKNMEFEEAPPSYQCDDYSSVSGKELYNELKMSGYEYGPVFQGLVETNMDGTAGLVLWQDKWIPFLDSLLLFFGLINNNKDFALPTGALSFKIDPTVMWDTVQPSDSEEQSTLNQNIPVTFDPHTGICRSVGVEITNLSIEAAHRRGKTEAPTLEKYCFTPYLSNFNTTAETRLEISQYTSALNEIVSNLTKSLGVPTNQSLFPVEENEEFDFDLFLSLLSTEHRLFSTLAEISKNVKNFNNKKKAVFSSYADFIGEDYLNNMIIHEDSLRIMLGIITENTFRKLSILEVNRGFPIILTQLIEIMQKYSHIKFKKSTLVAPKGAKVDKELLDTHNIQLLGEDRMQALSEDKIQDIVISSFTTGSESELHNLLNSVVSIVKSNGFILFFFKGDINPAERFLSSICGEQFQVQSRDILEIELQKQNLVVLSRLSDPFGGSLYLLRHASPPAHQIIVPITEGGYGWVDDLKRAIADKESGTVWLVTEDSPINGLIGMVNCLKQEPGGEKVRCVFLSQKSTDDKLPPFSIEHPFYRHLQAKNLMMNVWREGTWGSYRHSLIREAKVVRKVQHSYVHCQKYGDLSSFAWEESQVKYIQPKDETLVHIYYSGLNFRDIMLATGKISISTTQNKGDRSVLGLEYSGKDSEGKRICGFVQSKGMATSAYVDPTSFIEVPDHWTLEEAATVPVVYATCYYALLMRARLRQGQSILIHSGTGGIGIAAINIALSLNCKIFTTVGNEEKRKYLKQQFPTLKDENIGCSRNTSFRNMVLKRTNGYGVDVILNSLADDKFQASLQCLAKHGRFVEIGKYDLALDRKLGLKMFLQNVDFSGVFLDQLFDKEIPSNAVTMREIMSLINDGIKKGVVKPLDRTVFALNEVEEAFRYMAKGVHMGKVILKIRDEEPVRSIKPKTLMLPAIPHTYFHHDKVYIIIGGIGGFGIEVTKWIISKGARNIILTSRYGERTPYHYFCLKRWTKEGINVQVSVLNVAIRSEAEQLLLEAARIAPVGGIFNSAVVLKDSFVDCQTQEDFRDVCAPKATASKYLDELSRKLCPSLDYFICFSSISCGKGNAGQTNYGYANSVMERICEERTGAGLHGLAIQWGIIGEVGVVHRHMGDDAMIAGVVAQSVRSCLDTLDVFCQQDSPVVTSYVTAAATKKSTQGDTLTQIVKIFGMNDISEVSTTRSFGEMGIDSMVGIEMKQMIDAYCDTSLSLQEILDMKIGDVKDMFAKADAEKTSSQAAPTLLATTSVNLPTTLVHTDPLVVINKDSPGIPVFIVDIGDTDVRDFQTLANIINKPVYGLVWTKSATNTDINSLASWYLKILHDTAKGPFHVLGHGLGGVVAFEMGLQNQKSDKSMRTLTLLNGSEDLCNSFSKDETEAKDPEVTALCRFVEQFAAGATSMLEEQLLKTVGLEQRIKIILTYLTSSSTQTINKNEVADAISNHLKKLNLIGSYTPAEKLSKDIHLIEDPVVVLANDVSLIKELFEEACRGKVTIQRVFSYRDLMNKEGAERLAMVLQTII